MTAYAISIILVTLKQNASPTALKEGVTITFAADGNCKCYYKAGPNHYQRVYDIWVSKTIFPNTDCQVMAQDIWNELDWMVQAAYACMRV